ncbi:hypothetical protein SDC9_127127 [bioreactor metagenome]|uniref:Uncharacterized protein n=1 Tax=bioreactor metagenome TaxID=1076179 RepID=A0A645CT39_9ZZZZ
MEAKGILPIKEASTSRYLAGRAAPRASAAPSGGKISPASAAKRPKTKASVTAK